MFLGLRLLEGVTLDAFREKYQVDLQTIYGDVLQPLLEKEYLEWAEDRIRLTSKGLLMANDVFEQFLLSID